MKNPLIKLVLLNVLIGIILLIAFYLSAFLSGYGSNVSHLPEEKRLFIGFVIFHFIVNVFLLYRLKQFNWIGISVSILLIAIFYFVEAWQFEYFK
ncbi:MAG TPA: hypothetical protein VGI82_07285 [Chitinophagaceae bacterium]|jgi:hypothetical protein